MSPNAAQVMAFATLGVLAAVVAAVVFSANRHNARGVELTAEERAQALAKEGRREQLITFSKDMAPIPGGSPDEVRLYAIGVGQVTLGEPESIGKFFTGQGAFRGFKTSVALGNSGSMTFVGGNQIGRFNTRHDGPFNNLLIFDTQTGESQRVFDQRLSIPGFVVCNETKTRVIAILAAERDTNKDGLVDGNDLLILFLYSPDERKLHRVTGLDASVDDVLDVPNVDYVIVRASRDRNGDGKITDDWNDNNEPEPQSLYRVDLHDFTATPLVTAELTNKLQETLDGVAPAKGGK